MWENETEQARESAEPKKDFKLAIQLPECTDKDGIIIMQAAICVAIIIFVLLSRAVSSPFFMQLKEQYNQIVNSGVDLSGQGELIRFVGSFIKGLQMQAGELMSKLDEEPQAAGGAEDGSGFSFTPVNAQYKLSVTPLMPTNGNLSSGYGERKNPITGKNEFHAGLDLAAEKGSRVFASFSGIIEKTGRDKVRGNYIIISHTSGLKTIYQHLEKIFVKQGDEVLRGQIIGLVGKTGMATGYHLHYELIISGHCVNPQTALKIAA